MGAKHRSHWYARASAEVRRRAWADPTTRCWRCGRTQAEHRRRWHAGHTPWGLAPECEACNTADGGRIGNRRRRSRDLRTTRDW